MECRNDFGRALRVILGLPLALICILFLWIIGLVFFAIMCLIFVGGSMFGVKEDIFQFISGEGPMHASKMINDLIVLCIGNK